MNQPIADTERLRRTKANWPYLAAPVGIYLLIMVPICLLELFLIATPCPNWMRISGGAVLFLTASVFVRGYMRRLVLTLDGARFRTPLSTIDITWERVHRVGVYSPGGGLGTTKYVYITTHDTPPRGKWDITSETIQLQDRPGLMESIEQHRGAAIAGR